MAWRNLEGVEPKGNYELCNALGISSPLHTNYRQIYEYNDINVKVLGGRLG
jgi:hypothetical protein